MLGCQAVLTEGGYRYSGSNRSRISIRRKSEAEAEHSISGGMRKACTGDIIFNEPCFVVVGTPFLISWSTVSPPATRARTKMPLCSLFIVDGFGVLAGFQLTGRGHEKPPCIRVLPLMQQLTIPNTLTVGPMTFHDVLRMHLEVSSLYWGSEKTYDDSGWNPQPPLIDAGARLRLQEVPQLVAESFRSKVASCGFSSCIRVLESASHAL